MSDHLLITRGALYGLIVSYVIALFAVGWIAFVSYELSNERNLRAQQVNATLAFNCARQNAISKPSRDLFRFVLQITNESPQSHRFRLVLRQAVKDLTPVDCSKLPVFR